MSTHKAEIHLFLLTCFKNKLTGESNKYLSYKLCIVFVADFVREIWFQAKQIHDRTVRALYSREKSI